MKNRLGIVHDPEELAIREREFTTDRAATVHDEVSGNFDADHLKALHKHIFQDVYEWAGTTRGDTITLEGERVHVPSAIPTLSKGSTDFLPSAYMERGLTHVAEQAARPGARSADPKTFAEAAAEVFASLNHAHPFREGNGRTQRAFMEQLAERAGHTLDFRGVTGERMVQASIEAHHGDTRHLRDIIVESIDPARVTMRMEAVAALDRSGLDADAFWIETATVGDRVAGQLLGRFSEHCSVLTDDNRLIVAPAAALPDNAALHRPVSFVFEGRHEISTEREQLEQALTVAPPELRPALDARLNALDPEASREAATDSIYAPESARDIGPAVKDGASADLKDALRGSGIDAGEVAARLQITAQNAALEAQWVERDIRSVAAAEGCDMTTDAGRSMAEDKTIEYYNKVEIALAAQLDREQAAALDEAKTLAAETTPLTQEQAERLKEAVEKALGPEKIAAMERGEAVAIPGLSDIKRHDFAVAYLEAREQFGENHRNAIHAHHGQAVTLEQEAKREQRGHEQRGLDWD